MALVLTVALPEAESAPDVRLPWLVCGQAPCVDLARWRDWPAGMEAGPDRVVQRLELRLAGGLCLTLQEPPPDYMVYNAGLILRWEDPARAVFFQDVDLTRAGWPELVVGDEGTQMDAARSGAATVLWHRDGPPARLWKIYVVPERLRHSRYVLEISLAGYSERQVEAVLAGLRACGGEPVAR